MSLSEFGTKRAQRLCPALLFRAVRPREEVLCFVPAASVLCKSDRLEKRNKRLILLKASEFWKCERARKRVVGVERSVMVAMKDLCRE